MKTVKSVSYAFFTIAASMSQGNLARAQSLVDVCTGLSVNLPSLQPVPTVNSGLLAGLLDPVLNGLIGGVNTNVVAQLNGQTISVRVLDQNGNLVTAGNCRLTTDGLLVNANRGVEIGGGQITSLGGPGNPGASAASPTAIALGNGAVATAAAPNAVAIGLRSTVSAADAIAFGRDASASAPGAVAIGAGAQASRAGQFAFGTAGSTYTLPGLASAASRAAQSGPTQLVTTDAAGNLASAPFDINTIDRRITTLSDQVSALSAYGLQTRKESRQGIAASMSMASAPLPSAPGRTSWASSMGSYKGEWATGFAVAHRLNVPINVALNAAVSVSGGNLGGARVGLSGEF